MARKTSFKIPGISLFITLFLVLSIAGCGISPANTTSANIAPTTEIKAVEPVKVDPSTSAPSPTVASDGVVSTTTVLVGKNLKVSFIDVGQADSILIQTPGGKNVLIDAGNNGDASTIVTYLKAQNISRLDYVIATHSHEDHIGSMDTVINTFDIGQVVMPKESSTTQTFRDVMAAIASKGLHPIEAKAGVKLDLGP